MLPGLYSIFNHEPGSRHKHPHSPHQRADESQRIRLDPYEGFTNSHLSDLVVVSSSHPLSR